jgi:hypothetical protein
MQLHIDTVVSIEDVGGSDAFSPQVLERIVDSVLQAVEDAAAREKWRRREQSGGGRERPW